MKRILYSETVEVLNEYYAKICKYHRKSTLTKLKEMKDRITRDQVEKWEEYNKYLDVLINIFGDLDELQKLIALKKDEFESYDKFFPNNINLSTSNWFNPKSDNQEGDYKGSFYANIVDALNYKNIRDKEYADAIKKLGIRTCIYCNAEYMPIVEMQGRTYRCRFEADHFYPKNKRPFLCISFYNLLPSCAFCNRGKSYNDALFYLYTDDPCDLVPFSFKLDGKSVIDYMHFLDSEKLKIDFTNSKNGDEKLLENHEEKFHISQIYQSFKDEAEEILWKAKTINLSYVSQLKKSFESIFGSLGEKEIRYLYGFYDKEEDIHKRPLTKMKQDIAKQFGILKKTVM